MVHQIVETDRVIARLETVKGIELLDKPFNVDIIDEVIQEWTDIYYDTDEGFGSSDFTFLLKDVIDSLIQNKNLKTDFTPYLTILKK